MCVEISILIWKDISIRNKIEVFPAVLILKFDIVVAKPVFSCYFITGREMVYFLIFIQAFIQIALTGRRGPEDVPLVALRVFEPVHLQERPHQFGVATQDFVKQIGVFYVVGTGVGYARGRVV